MKFSVSMSVYQHDDPVFFRQALQSIINQTLAPSEIVLVVDGPVPDATHAIIAEHEASHEAFVVIKLAQNVGHGNARKIGLERCKYDLVALMDSDDLSLPYRFEKQVACFEQDPALSIVGGFINEFIDTDDNVVGVREVPLDNEGIVDYLKSRCPMNQVTVMFKKSEVMKAGGYIDWFNEEDYYLWLRMYLKGCKFKNLGTNLVNVRASADYYRRRGGWRYFKSEFDLQRFMLSSKIIGYSQFIYNAMIRFVVQLILPNRVRGFIYQAIFRGKSG